MKRKIIISSIIALSIINLFVPLISAEPNPNKQNITVHTEKDDTKNLETVNNYFIGSFRLYDENTGKIYDFQANKAFTYDYKKDIPPLVVNEYSYNYLINEMNTYFFGDTSKSILVPELGKDGKYSIKSIKLNTQSIDKEKLKKELSRKIKTADYSMIKIPVTGNNIAYNQKKEVVLLSSYSSKYNIDDKGRSANVEMSAKQIDGTKLAPDEKLSYNEKTRPIYPNLQVAKVIVGDEFVDGVGGGICQTSSTLFNTVLEAGLKINVRHNHSKKVFYLPPGRDAMVSYYHDFIFTNNMKNDIYIIYDNSIIGEITLKIYGNKSDKQNVKTWVESDKDARFILNRQIGNNLIKFYSKYK